MIVRLYHRKSIYTIQLGIYCMARVYEQSTICYTEQPF